MKVETKNRTLCFIALLFIAQCLVVTKVLAAQMHYIDIPQQTFKCIGGTVVISEQTLVYEEGEQIPEVRFKVVDTHKMVVPMELYSKTLNKYIAYIIPFSEYSGTIEYGDYVQMGEVAFTFDISPVTKPSDFVEVVNVFVPNGAKLNDKGEVVLLKNIDYDVTGKMNHPRIPIRTDITLIGNVDNAIDHTFVLEIEDSNITSDCALQCVLSIKNSTVNFKHSTSNIANVQIFTEGKVVFKGPCDVDIPPCADRNEYLNVSINANLDDLSNSDITFENLDLDLTWFNIRPTTTINFKNCRWLVPSYTLESCNITLKGGNVNIDNCIFGDEDSNKDVFLSVESGKLKIDRSQSHNIIVQGKDANVELNSGLYQGLTVQDGKVTVNNGYFPNGIEMNGGELEINGGKVALITVKDENSKIKLNNGLFGGIKIPSKVNKSIYSMLGSNAGYYDRDGTYMPFKLLSIEGNDETEGSIITGTTYPVSFVFSNYSAVPTPAFTAAQEASVGPDGTDIKVRDNGDLEIWTPKGLAWLAFLCSDTHDRVLTGREYFDNSKDWYLMADLDMDGYGELWPEFNINNKTFYGQQHRIYNMNIVRPDACFIKTVSTGAIVRDLIVEGSVSNMDDEGGRMPNANGSVNYYVSGFARQNKGLIVNCAYKGDVWNSEIGVVNIGGFVGTNHGRIENCYVAPCGQTIGGARYAGSHFENEYACSQVPEGYYVGGFAISNGYQATAPEDGFVENCYMGGNVSYGTTATDRDNISIEFVPGIKNMKGDPCERLYVTDADISAETLNKNALDHTAEMYEGTRYPYVEWAQWKESAGKQCGKPYFVWEKNIDDTPSVIDAVDAGNGFKVWSEDGAICFSNVQSADVSVYSVSGELVKQERGHVGTGRITLPKGLYVVKCGSVTKKVML